MRAAAADAHLDLGRGADGGPGHRREGGHAAGHCAGRGHRRGLRALHHEHPAGATAPG